MNISNSQVNRLRHFVRAGLRSLFRPEPQTAVEWADANYYLPKESAYQEGRWETLPFQRAIMNAMGSDYIREVNVVKSARVGYSKMLLGVYIERKQLDDFFELDDNFHQLLTQIADCQLAWDTIENLKATVDRVRYMSFDHVSPPEMLLRQHLDIFSALQKRDGDAVERAMTQHLQEISESVRQIRQENSDWFSEE